MERKYLKEYIEFSNEFKKSNNSKESTERIYDLLYELEDINRVKEDNLVLSNIYLLLGFYRSAYEVFTEIADLDNKKDVSKLYVMEQKAKSHENNFIIKDVRKYREKKEMSKLTLIDFSTSEGDQNKFEIPQKDIIIFNKKVKDRIFIYLSSADIQKYSDAVIAHIYWLSNCKNELIEFYNQNDDFTEEKANNDWYDTLEVYSIKITITDSGDIHTIASTGDDFFQDHILDVEITNRTIASMNYDG
ncbi:hypothetical protein [Flavobacterium collinsii]|uniref:DUF2262 domain-containing protein n=1 Tax=Flavobacterium collinsii TaxID=1114861 RepID=A0ABN7ELY5_9FLAO|nr:hypothetical protein [Flavobacterium collinsii]GIQ58025.1 hypothetical protein Flavo103_11610 [Flavobacterium collinsii]CAA9200220.1 hypothetical protein FLACOL7796_03121 [Flavobacterium collinsii]